MSGRTMPKRLSFTSDSDAATQELQMAVPRLDFAASTTAVLFPWQVPGHYCEKLRMLAAFLVARPPCLSGRNVTRIGSGHSGPNRRHVGKRKEHLIRACNGLIWRSARQPHLPLGVSVSCRLTFSSLASRRQNHTHQPRACTGKCLAPPTPINNRPECA